MINICTASNEKYVRYLYVMLRSLFEHSNKDDLRVFVLERDISEHSKNTLINLGISYGKIVEFLKVDESLFSFLPTTNKFSLETYFRTAMAEYIPDEIDRILYMDVDIIVQHSLNGLFTIDLKGKAFAACQDYGLPVLDPFRKKLFGDRSDNRYFNAGVMLWDMNLVRQKYTYSILENAARELGGELPYADQEILNYVSYGDIEYIDGLKYNYIADRFDKEEYREFADDALIIHYAACNPWQPGAKNELYKRWWETAKNTPFYVEFLEEQLDRLENSDSAFVEKRNWEMVQIFKSMYELKGTGKIRNKLNRYSKYLLYGAGYMAECFWNFIEEEKASKPYMVIDKNKGGEKFHDVPISATYEGIVSKEDVLIVVTPAGISDKICSTIKRDIDNGEVISLKDFLTV